MIDFKANMLKSKVALRIFTVFVLCSLVPLLLLSVFYFFVISDILYGHSEKSLRSLAKTKGLEIYNHLLFAESEMILMSENLNLTSIQNRPGLLPIDKDLNKRYMNIIIKTEDRSKSIYGKPEMLPSLDSKQKQLLQNAKTLLLFQSPEKIFLIKKLFNKNKVETGINLYFQLNPDFLWGNGAENVLPLTTELTVIEKNTSRIFSSSIPENSIRIMLEKINSEKKSRSTRLKINGTEYICSSWLLFLKQRYNCSNLIIAVTEKSSIVMDPLNNFRLMFILLLLLVFFIILLISLVQVRKILIPIITLHKGTDKISEGRLGYQVEIKTNDEFEQLGNSFNKMSLTLEKNRKERIISEQEWLRLYTAVEQSAEAILITDEKGKILYANPAVSLLTGYKHDEIIAGNVLEHKDKIKGSILKKEIAEHCHDGKIWSGNLTGRKEDGILYHTETSISPVKDEKGRIVNYTVTAIDISEKVKLEQHIRQSQKMEAIGTLAGGIAHDFNNILAAIMGFSQMGLMQSKDEQGKQFFEEILVSSSRARELVKQILTFSRNVDRKREGIRIDLIIKEVLKLIASTIPSTINIKKQITCEGIIIADPTEIHQVIMNLCTNAAHSMKDKGGTISVSLDEYIPEGATEKNPNIDPALKYILIKVKDEGHGMDSNMTERIFEPFFTTKEAGEGTGMGLSVVHGIVKELKGEIQVESALGKGSEFRIFLPEADTELEKSGNENSGIINGNGESIMIVDDEKQLLKMLKEFLSGCGYRVRTFSDSLKALEDFNKAPSDFDAAILDQSMPKLSGLALAEKMLSVKASLPVMLCTGYTEPYIKEMAEQKGIKKFIYKPLSPKDIATLLRELLDNN